LARLGPVGSPGGRKSAKKPVSHTENFADFCLDPGLLGDRLASRVWISTP
jgi:hypothetical protein